MAPAVPAEGEAEEAVGAPPSPPAFSVLHDKALAVEQVALCPKMDLAAVLMADGTHRISVRSFVRSSHSNNDTILGPTNPP